MTDSTVPRPALLLGAAGLLPTVAAVAVMLALPEWQSAAARIAVAYGALIASFVGGAWWGLVSARPEPGRQTRLLLAAVVPSLCGWAAFFLAPAMGLLLLSSVFALLPLVDDRLRREGIAPDWWMGLRLPLSFAMTALHAGASAVLLLSRGPLPG